MSVAKALIEDINAIKVERGLLESINAFKRLIKYYKPYIHFLIIIVVFSILRSYLFHSRTPIHFTDNRCCYYIGGKIESLSNLIIKTIVAVILFGIVNFFIVYFHGYFAQIVIRDIRSNYYSSLQNKSFRFYDSAIVGDLVSRATMDLQAVEGFLKSWVGTLCNAIFTVIIVFGTMLSINPTMSFLSIIPITLVFYFTSQLWMKTMPLFRKMMLILGRLGAYIQQNIIGMSVIRIFQREKEMKEGFKQVEEIYVNTAITAGRIQSIYTPLPQAILTFGIAVIYLYGGNLIASPEHTLTIGELTLFARYMTRLSFPLRDLGQLLGTWINASAGLERVFEIMDPPVDVKDEPDAQDITIKKGEIVFENVTFGYKKGKPVLKNISFKVKPGEKIAILGATGSGETTLVYLIPRFYDVDSGRIMIDGVDVRKFKLSSLRRQVGLVLQDIFLFTGTIKDNIAFGNPDAPMDSIIKAAKIARIRDFVESLPEGYNTMIGERGVTLSGGQKQRITIARALLTDPKILILDDSLSFVDAKTEQEIQEAMNEAMKGRTCFIIAQRLSTIRNADRIMVLEDGEIVEFGTHEELLAKSGIYRKIYETQFLEKAPLEILRKAEMHV
jgi:ATP-binding cassette subfamily B protein